MCSRGWYSYLTMRPRKHMYFLLFFIISISSLQLLLENLNFSRKKTKMSNPECFQYCKSIVQYTTAAVLLNSISVQPAVYQELSRTASEIFMIMIFYDSVNHLYDFHKYFSRGWVDTKQVLHQLHQSG